MIRSLAILFLFVALSCGAQTPLVQPLPTGWNEGINLVNSNSIGLVLFAPNQPYCYVKGDFNNWQVNGSSLMNKTPDGNYHWVQLNNLNPQTEYRYQYVVGTGAIECADPYAEKILDPWNDQWIPWSTYPNLISYPNQTSWPVSVFQMNQPNYVWNDSGFVRPARNKLNIYELLIRDFSSERNFQSVIDRLDYLEYLGINAIQLMPVFEFDGNESWGYNPNFWFAPDKYYGTKNKLKELVDLAHQRGIAIVIDVVFNHSWGLNPQVRLYNEDPNGFGPVSADSPWLNTIPTHDFNVGTDYNHESIHTRNFVKRVLSHWIDEYHIDGFRFDLSKGFTQNNTLGSLSAWSAYDQSRIDILNDYASHVWSNDNEVYMILEHLADNNEEQVLANAGFLLWGPLNHDYSEAAMGYPSDLSWASYQSRGFNYANLIAYMESHDEERLMWKCKQFGNSNAGYDIKQEDVALQRMQLCNAFYLTLPGPKMIWQFGELGYDISINDCGNGQNDPSCRLNNRPVLWSYYDDPERRELYEFVSALNQLRLNYESMHTSNYAIDLSGFQKRINLYGSEFNLVAIGNFDVVAGSANPNFPNTGTWYEFNSPNTLEVSNPNQAIALNAGEFKIYTDIDLNTPQNQDVLGCTDLNAENFNPLANISDNSCLYELTFQVRTGDLQTSPNGIHIAGNFQGWDPAASPMTEVSSGLWEISLLFSAGTELLYKFINGNQWGNDEVVPASCGILNSFGGFDRTYVTGTSSEQLSPHCFGSCEDCVIEEVTIVFRVDMSNESISASGVHIAGNFQGWNPSATAMTEESPGIYSYSQTFVPGELVEYKFINGNAWGADESVPAECAAGLNRFYTVPALSADIGLVCYGACGSCVANSCSGDFNSDNFRNVNDLLFLLAEMGCQELCLADLNGDGTVNTGDTILFLGLFGSPCD